MNLDQYLDALRGNRAFMSCVTHWETLPAQDAGQHERAHHPGVPALPRADNGALIEEIRLFFHLGKSAF